MRQLLQQNRATDGVHASKLAIPDANVVELVRVLGLHEEHGLLQLVEVLLQDGRVVEGVDEVGEVLDVLCEGGDAVRVDFLDGGGEGEGED